MDGKPIAIASRRSLLYFAVGNLIAAIIWNPPAPARAYDGIFETIGQAWNSVSGQAQPDEGPIDDNGQPLNSINPWHPYNRGSMVTEAEWAYFNHLRLPQRRETLDKVIGTPSQVNYASVYGYESHPLYSGKTLEITYQNGTDQRGHAGWVAIAAEVR